MSFFERLDVLPTAMWVSGFCLFCEAFFALAEIAIISCDRIALRKAATEGQRTARLVENFLEHKQRLLATTLVGTQLSVVVSTVVMTFALHRVYPDHAELYLLTFLVPVTVVLGEIVPKSLARQYADRVARLVAWPLFIASKIFFPLIATMTALSGWLTRRLGLAERKLVTREELGLLLQGPAAPSGITDGERRMISRIFDFSKTTVEEVMVPLSDVAALPESAGFADLVSAIEEKHYTRYPVYRERVDHIVGIVHAFDVLKAGATPATRPTTTTPTLGDIARSPIFVPTSKPTVDLLLELQRSRQSMAVVVDEYGGAIGLVTVEDVLEQIVGPIDDEHDQAEPAIRKEPDGSWRVAARTTVAEINRQLRIGLPEAEEYTTVGGLVLDRLKHIPREGESVRVGQVLLRVSRATDRSIEEVVIRLVKRRAAPEHPA